MTLQLITSGDDSASWPFKPPDLLHSYVYQGQGQLMKKMAFRPASLSSRFHRRLTAAVEKKHKKVQKVQKVTTVLDPNKEKAERERAEEQRIRDRESLQRRQVHNLSSKG